MTNPTNVGTVNDRPLLKLNPLQSLVTTISGVSIGFFAWSFTVTRRTFHSYIFFNNLTIGERNRLILFLIIGALLFFVVWLGLRRFTVYRGCTTFQNRISVYLSIGILLGFLPLLAIQAIEVFYPFHVFTLVAGFIVVTVLIGHRFNRKAGRSTVVDILKQLKESAPFYRGIIPWTGFPQIGVHYTAAKRYSGCSKYSLIRMIQFALAGLLSFSVMPLRLATVIGFIMAASGFIIGVKAVYEALFTARTVPGWASTIVSVVFVGGVQLLILGIIGEYLGHLFIESKRRPHYILRERSLAEEDKK